MSKFQELIDLNQEDRKATYDYVSRIVLFVSVMRQKLVEYLECNPQDIQFLGKEDTISYAHGSATVDEEGYLNFRILATLSRENFNINECGQDFFLTEE
jgi:hypothetical protein